MHHVRLGQGRPLLLIHGLGGSWRSWGPILGALAKKREVIAIDLPGFGETPPLPGKTSIATLADAVTGFLAEHGLTCVDAVGSSMGARLTLELARRGGVLGATVSLDPGGFWQGWERAYFETTIKLSIQLVRRLQPVMPLITGRAAGRTLLFPQFSPRPWRLNPVVALAEMRSYAASPRFDELLDELAHGPTQQGAARGTLRAPATIVWGRQDRVCLPRQARRAQRLFPDARLRWFDQCGHFPHWDLPEETARLILGSTGQGGALPRVADPGKGEKVMAGMLIASSPVEIAAKADEAGMPQKARDAAARLFHELTSRIGLAAAAPDRDDGEEWPRHRFLFGPVDGDVGRLAEHLRSQDGVAEVTSASSAGEAPPDTLFVHGTDGGFEAVLVASDNRDLLRSVLDAGGVSL